MVVMEGGVKGAQVHLADEVVQGMFEGTGYELEKLPFSPRDRKPM
jgi:hypothetical protein